MKKTITIEVTEELYTELMHQYENEKSSVGGEYPLNQYLVNVLEVGLGV